MADRDIVHLPAGRLAAVLADQGARLLAVAVVLMAAGAFLLPPPFGIAALAAGGTLAFLAGAGQWLVLRDLRQRRAMIRDAEAFAASDPTPCLLTAFDGEIRFMNEAARKRFRSNGGATLARLLSDLFANPAGVLFRLQERANTGGGAREDVVTRRGHVRLTALSLGAEGFLWRFDEILEGRGSVRGAESLNLPMLTASPSGAILFMNEALRRVIGERVKHIERIFHVLPVRPGAVQEILTSEGPTLARVAEISGPGGRRELYFLAAEAGAVAAEPGQTIPYDDLPVAIVRLSPSGAIDVANRLARELLHAERGEDLAGVFLGDRLEGLGRSVRDWLAEASHGRGLGRPEVLRVRGREAECFVQVTLTQAREAGTTRLVAVMSDATELKTLEAQFVQSQKMQAIGQLAGGVAHDFNNLLTAISGHCDLMLLRHDEGDPDYADLVQIHQNANRAAALVGQLLAFSRKQTMQPQVLDVRDTLSDLAHLLNRLVGERVSLVLHHEAGLPAIRADRRQLEQVIMNLVVNARDAMPDGGEIRIETQSVVLGSDLERDRARVPAGRYVTVKVEDHGIGIPADKLSLIFEPFYTTKRTGEGTGLGLSTAYGIVKQSGGFIFVDSVVGVGTSFTLYFPAHEADASLDAGTTVASASRSFRSRRQAEAPASGEADGSVERSPAATPSVPMPAEGAVAVPRPRGLNLTLASGAGARSDVAEPSARSGRSDAGERSARRAVFGIGPVQADAAAARAGAGDGPGATPEASPEPAEDCTSMLDAPGEPTPSAADIERSVGLADIDGPGPSAGQDPGGSLDQSRRILQLTPEARVDAPSSPVPEVAAQSDVLSEALTPEDRTVEGLADIEAALKRIESGIAAGSEADDGAARGPAVGVQVDPDEVSDDGLHSALASLLGSTDGAAAVAAEPGDGGVADEPTVPATGPGGETEIPRTELPESPKHDPRRDAKVFVASAEPGAGRMPTTAPAPEPEPVTARTGAKPGGVAATQPENDADENGEAVILLVEDEAPVRAFASRALRMRGYTVIEAENAEQALATLEDPRLKVDVFVTDVIMPGMDGPSWVRRALQTRPGVRVVFVSGYAEDSFGDEQARIPNSVFLPKPFSLSELTDTVNEQIH